MENYNSLGVYTLILERLVEDIAIEYVDSISTPALDLEKLRKRIHREGFSFVTKTLPLLGKAFDKALQGEVPFAPTGWQKPAGRSTPKFLWWLFERIFDENGYIRSDACIRSIKHVRQILQLLYKLEIKNDDESTQKVLSSFFSVQTELKKLEVDETDAIIRRARTYITRVLSGLHPREIIPSHGPGAVATGEKGGSKTHFSRLYRDMERVYPFTEYFHVSVSHTADRLQQLEALEELESGTAKVVLVPKDSRGPRLISCEPLEKQWIQQGQRQALYRHIERHPMTRGHVNFSNQGVNRELALIGSETTDWVTLDMKEASDRVSLKLVSALFQGTDWFSALIASRSKWTRMPDGQIVELETFAPMGSAVCFPIEALVFWALSVAAIVTTGTPRHIAMGEVYVYGDDIICRREVYPVVMQQLERFGLMFNRNKCCVSGFFRESCGCDAYKGVDVTPIRLRKTWSRHAKHDVVQLQSYVEFSNSMYERGYRGVAEYVERLVERLYGAIPYMAYQEVSDWEFDLNSLTLGRKRFPTQRKRAPLGRVIGFDRPDANPLLRNLDRGIKHRFNRYLHYYEVYGYASKPRRETWVEDGWESVLRSLNCGATGLPNGVYAVPRRSRKTRTWSLVSY